MLNKIKDLMAAARHDADRRKLQIFKRAGGATAFFLVMMLVFDASSFFGFCYLLSGVIFATLMCWEPYYDTLPKKVVLGEDETHVYKGYGFFVQYPKLDTTKDRYITTFYYMPYNHLAWKISSIEFVMLFALVRHRKSYFAGLLRALFGWRETTAILAKEMIDHLIDLSKEKDRDPKEPMQALVSSMAIGLNTLRVEPKEVKEFAIEYVCEMVIAQRRQQDAQ